MDILTRRVLIICQSTIKKSPNFKTSFISQIGIFSNRHLSTDKGQVVGIDKTDCETLLEGLNSKVSRRRIVSDRPDRPQIPIEFFDVTAYATADEYRLENMKDFFKVQPSYSLKQLPEDAMDVLHVEIQPHSSDIFKGCFIFREGSIVFWNFSHNEKMETLRLLVNYQSGPYEQKLVAEQTESLNYCLSENKTGLVNGEINLQQTQNNSVDPLEMLAFSNAISHSVKLAVWEASLDTYVTSNESVIENLQNGRKLNISMGDVLKKCGKLYSLRHLINLSSTLLDTPDFYWDRSNLEKLYRKTCLFFNIPFRTRVINEKLHESVEFVELIRDHLKDKHHTRLELMIIFLITIEVFFGTFHFLDRYLVKEEKDL